MDKKTTKFTNESAKGCATLSIFLIILVFYFSNSCDDEIENTSEVKIDLKIDGLDYARRLMTNQLKAPSTADYPWGGPGHPSTLINDTTIKIVDYVDSQNSFGAMIRTNYSVTIYYHKKYNSFSFKDFQTKL